MTCSCALREDAPAGRGSDRLEPEVGALRGKMEEEGGGWLREEEEIVAEVTVENAEEASGGGIEVEGRG